MNLKQIQASLRADSISRKDGIITVRWGYYYRMGKTPSGYVARVKDLLPTAEILDSGDHFASFRGGQSVANGSHMFVKFKVI